MTKEQIFEIVSDGKKVLACYRLDDKIVDGENIKGLKTICNDCGLSKSGKKTDIVNRIWEYCIDKIIDRNAYILNPTTIANYVYKTNMHKIIARSCIRKIADNYNDNNKRANNSYLACNQIVNSHFTEEIVKDIENSVGAYIWECAMNMKCYIRRGWIYFTNPDFSDDNGQGYLGVYHVIGEVLKAFALKANQLSKGEYIPVYDKNGNERELSENSTRYITELSKINTLYDCEHTEDVKMFLKWIRKKYSVKIAIDFMHIIAGRCDGLTVDDIKKTYGISRSTFDRRSVLLKVAYGEYSKECDNFKFVKPSHSLEYGGYRKNETCCNDGFKYGLIIDSDNTIKHDIKTQSDYYHTFYECDYGVWYERKTDTLSSESMHDSKPINCEFLGQASPAIIDYCNRHMK